MLYPQANDCRQCHNLADMWDFLPDPDDIGRTAGWSGGLDGARPIAVPASWNEQFAETRDFLGPGWYQVRFSLPWGWVGQRIAIRFNSVHYLADVWLNGSWLGSHEGGHLPFAFDITGAVQAVDNTLVVRVDGQLAPDRVPPGNVPPDERDAFAGEQYPPASFDFFPYCGIDRPVLLYTIPSGGIADITITTTIAGKDGAVHARIRRDVSDPVTVQCTLSGHGPAITSEPQPITAEADIALTVPDAALWSPEAPNLYALTVTLERDGVVIDRYTLQIGIRTVEIRGTQILLNGKLVMLRGFGRHEDFPVTGRGYVPAVLIKDYALMQWMGANSFRTTHYPYSEQMMDLADRLGFLVIDETPAVGLFFDEAGLERRRNLCRQYVEELIDRDKNHPSVVMWSLANEPHSRRPEAAPFFRDLYDRAKGLDPSRPATLASYLGANETAFDFCDVICLNRYLGWYTYPGQIAAGCQRLAQELGELIARFSKPVVLTEFGADALAGHHAEPAEMFSEEYQAEMLLAYLDVLEHTSGVAGYHIWNLCDFKTPQSVRRVGGLNLKGIFTRDRRPKLAAHRVRTRWLGK